MHSIGKDMGNSCKQLFNLRFLNAFNWQIHVGNFCKLEHLNKIKVFECSQLVNACR